MHAISFVLKRAHLVTTAFGQEAVRPIDGMTPARYDVLALIREHSIRVHFPKENIINTMYQSTIVRRLGLHPSTVSKMLRRMEVMGWIRRYRDLEKDARLKIVELTQVGFQRAHRAMSRVYRSRLLSTPFERLARLTHPSEHVLLALEKIWGTVDGIARFFGDTSSFTYEGGVPKERVYRRTPASDEARPILEKLIKRTPRKFRPYIAALRPERPRCAFQGGREWDCAGHAVALSGPCAANLVRATRTRGARAICGGPRTSRGRDIRCRKRFPKSAPSQS